MRILQCLSIALLVSGCGAGESAVFLTVNSSNTVPGVDHLHLTAINAGQTAMAVDLALAGAPVTIPPARTFQLRFDKSRQGDVAINIDAMDARGNVIGSGMATATLSPSHESSASVMLKLGAAPMIASVTPDKGPTTGGTAITITGTGFMAGATVKVDGAEATDVSWISATEIRAKTPPRPGKIGLAAMTVTNPDGQTGTRVEGFRYFADKPVFAQPVLVSSGREAGVIVGDVDENGTIDIITTNADFNNSPPKFALSIFKGRGDGTFVKGEEYVPNTASSGAVALDLDRDGHLDIATMLLDPENSVLILLGNGDGTFRGVVKVPVSKNLLAIAAGDFNEDHLVDLVVGDGSGAYTVLIGKGASSFAPLAPVKLGNTLQSISVADLTGDGRLDLLLSNTTMSEGDMGMVLAAGDGNGLFQPIPVNSFPQNSCSAVIARDLTGDGLSDAICAGIDSIRVFRSSGAGSFGNADQYDLHAVGDALVADFDGDAVPDLMTTIGNAGMATPGLALLRGTGGGKLASAQRFASEAVPEHLAAADFDHDGLTDVATVNFFGGLSVWMNRSQ